MYQQKSTETVTLTRTQLQAILELITKIGGIGISENAPTEAWEEPKLSFRTQNSDGIVNRNNTNYSNSIQFESKSRANQLLDQKRLQWERERSELSAQDYWFRFRDERQHLDRSLVPSPSGKMIPLTPPSPDSISPPGTSSSGGDSVRGSIPTSAMSSVSTHYRRYARANDVEADFNAMEQKRLKVLQYQRELEEQKREKEKRDREEKERIKREEEIIERKIIQQQLKIKNEYEIEQQKIREKQEIAERKRAAVIAAIEKTPVLKKRNFQNRGDTFDTTEQDNEYILIQQTPVVATVLPQKMKVENNFQTETTSTSTSTRSTIVDNINNHCDVGVQTDFQLLFRWFYDMKNSNKSKSRKSKNLNMFEAETSSSNSSSPLSAPSSPNMHLKHRKFANGLPPKVILNNSSDHKRGRQRPEWGVNQPNKSYVRNTDKDPNRKFQEMRRKYWEKEGQQRTKRRVKNGNDQNSKMENIKDQTDEESPINSSLVSISRSKSCSQSIDNNLETTIRSHSPPTRSHSPPTRSHSPPIPAIQRRLSEQLTKSAFLPDINTNSRESSSLRPHSRKKWHSQETFYPSIVEPNQ